MMMMPPYQPLVAGSTPTENTSHLSTTYCSAGAGSDFFGKYQKHRTIEMERLRKMDEDWDKMQKDMEYHRKREENIKKDIEKTEKRRAKRNKRKENKRLNNKKKSITTTTSKDTITTLP
ncbi:conserved hypothetical protein [Perkinsus marinus ATCC 50983]|uniref:Uncharacterized protein n=1 Tax=Perkinsus marinus (strain ATCC 50983 / TXsc) TaxID=423536 RepID=C5KGP2_PERM5|nr:conserved hypothetical protein [Perkinsus marinus ATCC 50983]EER16310.1 conserved hypothetical protein [Perkinsus marinus ATCC 50983]|eukprot:XP_002784514.1 conserved hypothetical protein [Perkinsus marinus ATCC 50983]